MSAKFEIRETSFDTGQCTHAMQHYNVDGSNSTTGTSNEKLEGAVGIIGKKKRKYDESSTKEEGPVNKPYHCRFCDLNFAKSQALGGHMNRHRQEREQEHLKRAQDLVMQQYNTSLGYHPAWNMHSLQNPLSVPPPQNTHPRDYNYQPSFDLRGNNVSMQPSLPPSLSNFEFSAQGQSAPNTQYNSWTLSPIPTYQGANLNAMDTTKTSQSGASHGGIIPSVLQAQALGMHKSSSHTATGYPAGSNTRQDMLDTGNTSMYGHYEPHSNLDASGAISPSSFCFDATSHNTPHQLLPLKPVRFTPQHRQEVTKDPTYMMSSGGGSSSQFNQPQYASNTSQTDQMANLGDNVQSHSQYTNATVATNYALTDYWGPSGSSFQGSFMQPVSKNEDVALGLLQCMQSDPADPNRLEGLG